MIFNLIYFYILFHLCSIIAFKRLGLYRSSIFKHAENHLEILTIIFPIIIWFHLKTHIINSKNGVIKDDYPEFVRELIARYEFNKFLRDLKTRYKKFTFKTEFSTSIKDLVIYLEEEKLVSFDLLDKSRCYALYNTSKELRKFSELLNSSIIEFQTRVSENYLLTYDKKTTNLEKTLREYFPENYI